MLKILFYQSPKYRAFDEMLKKFRFLNETETLKNGFLSLFHRYLQLYQKKFKPPIDLISIKFL